MNGYRIAATGRTITCLHCGVTSHNQNDVRERYCGNCHKFHEDGGDHATRENLSAGAGPRGAS